MRLSRIAITLLVVALVAAFAVPGAIACDKSKAAQAETASTTTAQAKSCESKADAQTASAENCDPAACADKTSATTASTKTASSSCSKTAAASATTVAGSGCASKASATQTAGAGCSSKTASAAKYDIAVETVKLPSGALAVMYNGNDADTVAMLHSAANGSAADFMCPNVQEMAKTENCTVEMATTEEGLIFLCTSEDAELIESFAKNYEVAQAAPAEEQGE